MAEPLPYLLIAVKAIHFRKLSVSDIQISRLFPSAVSADGKYSLLNRDNLKQAIQMQLSGKQKTLCEFFCAFLKSSLKFEHFQTKDDFHS